MLHLFIGLPPVKLARVSAVDGGLPQTSRATTFLELLWRDKMRRLGPNLCAPSPLVCLYVVHVLYMS